MSPRQGIVDLSLPLAAEPALGTYTIHVERKTHSFSVEEYGVWGWEVHGGWEPRLGTSPRRLLSLCWESQPRSRLSSPPVLPKFEVTIDLPPSVWVKDEKFQLQICGR